jgi:molybdate transport system substrate-binding protein
VPNIQTIDALKRTLLDADAIIHNDLASGLLFAKQLERIGLAEQLKPKTVVIKGNTQLVELAKRKGNDVAAGQLTQLIQSKDVQLVGALPPEAQAETVYAAGAFSDSKIPDAAKAFVQFLSTPPAAAAFSTAGAR